MKRNILLGIKILFIVAACFLIIKNIDFSKVLKLFSKLSLVHFSFAVLVCILDKVMMGFKWNYLLKINYIHVPLSVPIIANLRAKIFHFFVPSTMGEDVYKTYFLKKSGSPIINIVSSIFLERFIGALSSFAIISLLIYFPLKKLQIPHYAFFTVLGLLSFLAITMLLYLLIKFASKSRVVSHSNFLPRKVVIKLNEFLAALSRMRDKESYIWVYYFLSIIEKISYGSAIYFSARAIGVQHIEYIYFISAIPFLALLERLPISISSIGVREGLFVVLFMPFQVDPTTSVTVAFVYRLAEVVMTFLCLVFWFGDDERKFASEGVELVGKEVMDIQKKQFDNQLS